LFSQAQDEDVAEHKILEFINKRLDQNVEIKVSMFVVAFQNIQLFILAGLVGLFIKYAYWVLLKPIVQIIFCMVC
jgi:hypothetical protein